MTDASWLFEWVMGVAAVLSTTGVCAVVALMWRMNAKLAEHGAILAAQGQDMAALRKLHEESNAKIDADSERVAKLEAVVATQPHN